VFAFGEYVSTKNHFSCEAFPSYKVFMLLKESLKMRGYDQEKKTKKECKNNTYKSRNENERSSLSICRLFNIKKTLQKNKRHHIYK
jgi:uncharacterized phage-like protein YoqJ